MGMDLLIIRKNPPEAWVNISVETGLRTLARFMDVLNAMAVSAGAQNTFDDFFDPVRAEAAFYEEFHDGEEMPEGWLSEQELNWADPADGISLFELIQSCLEKMSFDDLSKKFNGMADDLIKDLNDGLKCFEEIKAGGDLFCFDLSV